MLGTGWIGLVWFGLGENKLGKTSTGYNFDYYKLPICEGKYSTYIYIYRYRYTFVYTHILYKCLVSRGCGIRGSHIARHGAQNPNKNVQKAMVGIKSESLATLEVIFKVCTRFKRKRWR